MTRRALLGSAAAAGMVAATPWPLRALAQGGGGSGVTTQWITYAESLVPTPASAVAYAIVESGQISAAEGLGKMSKKAGAKKAGPHAIFELGSVTKVFTAILLGLTIEPSMGVTLETELGPFLPRTMTNIGVGDLTFGQLAQYASCLHTSAPGFNSPHYKLKTLVAWLNGQKALLPPACMPGTDYYYSNLAWGLLGYSLGKVWGTSWTHLVRDQVALPLGMTDTRRSGTQTHNQQRRTVAGYGLNGKSVPPRLGAPFLGGGGELVSTAADMAKFVQVNLDPSSAPGNLPAAIQFAQSSLKTYTEGIVEGQKTPVPKPLNPPVQAGIGWFGGSTPSGQAGWSKNGGTTGFGSFVGFIPAQGIGIFLVANSKKINPQRMGRKVLGISSQSADPG